MRRPCRWLGDRSALRATQPGRGCCNRSFVGARIHDLAQRDFWKLAVHSLFVVPGTAHPLRTWEPSWHLPTTLRRHSSVLLGLGVGIGAGLVLGYLLGFSRLVRDFAWTPLNWLRVFPTLATVTLFQFWFGANTNGTTAFIAFGVWAD